MRLLSLFICSGLAAIATAAILAADLPNGVYHAYTDEHGLETHTRLSNDELSPRTWTHDLQSAKSNSTVLPTANPSPLAPRKICLGWPEPYDIYCGCGFELDPHNCDAAVADLKNQVGTSGIIPTVGHAYYSIRGNVVSFICAFSNNPPPEGYKVTSQFITDALESVTSSCGRYIAGTNMPLWGDTYDPQRGYDLGYMQYTAGLDFCSHARDDSSNCC